MNSPIFQSVIDFTEAGADLGTTQYTDAFQRESFWPTVSGNPGYHVLLGQPTVQSEVTLNVPSRQGKVGTEFGVQVALVDINYIDPTCSLIWPPILRLHAGSVPVFVAYNTYETSGGCCIGGYHSANGAQSYMMFDYVGKSGVFSQDVSALSHEMSEWLDDPSPPTTRRAASTRLAIRWKATPTMETTPTTSAGLPIIFRMKPSRPTSARRREPA